MSTTSPEPDSPDVPPATPADGLPDPAPVGPVHFSIDIIERAVATYLEAFVSLLMVANVIGLSTATAAAVAAVPAGLTVIKTGLSRFITLLGPVRTGPGFIADLAERAAATYLEALVAFLAVADTIGVSTLAAAALAAIPTALAVVKAALARFLGDRESAAAIPAWFLKAA